MSTDIEWLASHGTYSDEAIEYFAERVAIILDSFPHITPQAEWQARMMAWQELRTKFKCQ